MLIRSVFVGCGSFQPSRVLSNSDLASYFDTSDEWIRTRTGIESRAVVGKDELTSDIAVRAACEAIDNAGLTPEDIDMILLATTTPDRVLPATAVYIQKALGLVNAFAFDIQAVCAGFIYAVVTADSFIASKRARNVLVIGADTMSRILDWHDRTTAVLFGDGAGAVVMQRAEGNNSLNDRGVLSSRLYSDGSQSEILCVPRSTARSGAEYLTMNGREVFKFAVKNQLQAAIDVIKDANITVDEIDWVIPHQANSRIINALAEKMGIPQDKLIVTINKHANTSAASIPMALREAIKHGKIQQGDVILFLAMGAGLSWGAVLLRW